MSECVSNFFLVDYILAALLPASLRLGIGLRGVDIRLESPRIEYLFLLEITYVKSVFAFLFHIFDLEVKPLQMPTRIRIHPHKQLILTLSYLFYYSDYLHCTVQVARLIKRVKLQLRLRLPILTAKLPVRKLYVVRGFHMMVRKCKCAVVPREVCVLVTWAQVTYLGFG
jgi:hypothetical protein